MREPRRCSNTVLVMGNIQTSLPGIEPLPNGPHASVMTGDDDDDDNITSCATGAPGSIQSKLYFPKKNACEKLDTHLVILD